MNTALDDSPRTLFRLSWPIFIELLLGLLVGNMDQIQLSHFNDTAVAAVGNANTVITVIVLLLSVVSSAATILISQYRGAGDSAAVNRLYTLSVFVNLAFSAALSAAVILGASPLLRLMRVPAELVREARVYLILAAASMPFQAMMMTYSSFLRAGALMQPIMRISVLVNVGNVLGNAALINGFGPLPRCGAAGAALSSGIFRGVGMLLMMASFRRSLPDAQVRPALLRPFPKELFSRLLAIGLPSAGEGLSYNLSQASCLVLVNLMGAYVVTTRMYGVMLANCIYMLISAVSQAGQILIGYRVGAGDPDAADRCCRRILRIFCPLNVCIAALFCLFARPLYGLFSADARVIALGVQIMRIEVFLEIGRALNLVLVRALQAAGDIRFPVCVGIVSQWAVGVGVGYLLGVVLGWGLCGLWIAFALDEILRGIVFLARWRSGKWRAMQTVRRKPSASAKPPRAPARKKRLQNRAAAQ